MSWIDQWRASLVVGFTIFFGAGVLVGVGMTAVKYPSKPHRPGDATPVQLTVSKGMTPSAIARALAERDVLDHPSWFRIYATERGDASKVRPGRYTFRPEMTPKQILDALIAGVPEEEVAVT